MTTWAQQVKERLQALGSTPTADQARAITDRYEDTDVEAALVSMLGEAGGGGGGGSQTQTAAATVTTDPVTFIGSHVFDCGHDAAAVLLKATLTSHDADGETWDPQTGLVLILSLADSFDNATFREIAFGGGAANAAIARTWRDASLGGPMELVNDGDIDVAGLVVCRYLRVTATVYDENAGDVYAGANAPSAVTHIDLTYT